MSLEPPAMPRRKPWSCSRASPPDLCSANSCFHRPSGTPTTAARMSGPSLLLLSPLALAPALTANVRG
eukprot:14935699-Heterocapsa_arctica.AAC.1